MNVTRWVCGLVVVSVVLSAGSPVRADTINLLVPQTNMEGLVVRYQPDSGDPSYSVDTGSSYTGHLSDNHRFNYITVDKFLMDPAAFSGKTITSAVLTVRAISEVINPNVNPGGVEVNLAHYTGQNGTALDGTDYTAATETVGSSQLVDSLGYYSWDVTAAVRADVAGGFNYTSFAIKPVADSPMDYAVHVVRWADQDCPWPSLQACITVEYVPEPATLGLLLLGGATVLRRRST